MCSIVILKQSDSEWPIIIGANRDEMSNRDALPPGRHWDDRPHIFRQGHDGGRHLDRN